MISILAGMLFAAAHPQQGCQRDTLAAVVNDHRPDAPYVLVTATGKHLRAYGQDFVNPNEWRHGDALDICAGPDSASLRVRDLRRVEDLVTAKDRTPKVEPPLQIMNGPGFRALLARVATECPASRVRYATPAALLDADETFEAGLDSVAIRHLRAEKHMTAGRDFPRCASRDGASCPAGEAMDALQRAGLMERFTKVVCAHGAGPWG